MKQNAFETPVEQAARCLADDPSFRGLSSREEQRAEAKLLLAGIPGASPGDADDAILLALELTEAAASSTEEVTVSKANYQAGAWDERKILVRRPRKNEVFVPPPPRPMAGRPPSAESLASTNKLAHREKTRRLQMANNLLARFRACTGMSILSLSYIVARRRPTVQFYLQNKIQWRPDTAQLERMRDILLAQQKLVAKTLEEVEKKLLE
jgi:hypothetical protein